MCFALEKWLVCVVTLLLFSATIQVGLFFIAYFAGSFVLRLSYRHFRSIVSRRKTADGPPQHLNREKNSHSPDRAEGRRELISGLQPAARNDVLPARAN